MRSAGERYTEAHMAYDKARKEAATMLADMNDTGEWDVAQVKRFARICSRAREDFRAARHALLSSSEEVSIL